MDGRGDFGDRQAHRHDCTRRVGSKIQPATKLSESLSHASDSNSGCACGRHLLSFLGRDAFALVGDLDCDLTVALAEANPGSGTS